MELTGKVALVTGAARRVGRAIALELGRGGCDVAVHFHRSSDEAAAVVDEIRAMGREAAAFMGDLSELHVPARIVGEVIRTLGGVDILINNASVFEKTPVGEMDVTAWERIFRINVTAPAMFARAAAPRMKAAGAGRIINLTDIWAERPMREYDAYCASKAALVSLTRSLARELAPEVTVNAISPGIAVFPDDYDGPTRAKLIARVPLKRAGTPEELAMLVCSLLSTADYVTGQIIPYDGGRSIVP